jgi:hypothetical protein
MATREEIQAEIQATATRITDKVMDQTGAGRSNYFAIKTSTITILSNLPGTMTLAQYEADVYARLATLKGMGL